MEKTGGGSMLAITSMSCENKNMVPNSAQPKSALITGGAGNAAM